MNETREVALVAPQGQIIRLEEGVEPDQQLRRYVRNSLIGVAVLVFGIGGMAAVLPMAGAVIAPGRVSVESHVKEVGHPFGGVVAKILVDDGDRVEANQPLVMLDDTVTGANSELTGQSVDQLLAREARLRAERDGTSGISFPQDLTSRASDPTVAQIIAEERRNFQARQQARAAQIAQLNQRMRQAQANISASASQRSSYEHQAKLIGQELTQTRELYEERYTTLDRLNALERAAAGVEANRDTAAASIAEESARIAEMRAQVASVGATARSEAANELVQVQAALAELRRQKVEADDSFERSVIRAPYAGVVDKLAVKTVGAVIAPGRPVLEIVPDQDRFTVRASVAANDIDNVHVGQKAILVLTALNMRTTPQLEGKVSFVAADNTVDEATGVPFYPVTIEVAPSEFKKTGKIQMRVGMPVETFIQTSERTMLSYVVRPLVDQMRRAFRSD